MIKKIFLFLAFISLSANVHMAFAEEYDYDYQEEWWANAPHRYLPKATQLIISPTSACNQNGEAFKDFIPKFRNDATFRLSRVKFDSEENLEWAYNTLGYWTTGYQLFKAVQRKQRCDKSFGTWYNVSANEIYFQYEDVLPCDEDGGSEMRARFQRIDGKWYLTGLMLAG